MTSPSPSLARSGSRFPRRGEWLGFSALALAVAVSQAFGHARPQVDRAWGEPSFTLHLEDRIPAWMAEYDIPGVAVALIVEGHTTWTAHFGDADIEAGVPLSEETELMAHSISKSLTAWGVMRLVEQGQIDLDDPVEPHLDGFRFPRGAFATEQVTVRRLLSNSAGLPLGRFGLHFAPGQPLPALRTFLTEEAPRVVRQPGTAFEYSNTGFAVLELLVESLSQRSFGNYMAEEVLAPLGMRHSSFQPSPAMLKRTATGYDLHGRAVPPYLYPYRASGGLFTTLGDVARFVEASLRTYAGEGPGVLSRTSSKQMYEAQIPVRGLFSAVTDAYGLGHFVERLDEGRAAAWHGGQGLGWMTHFHLVPATGDGIVVFTNSQRSWPFFARVLGAWSRWRGLGEVGMGRLVGVQAVAGTLIGWMLLAAAWTLGRVAGGLREGRRRPCLRGAAAPGVRAIQALLGLVAFGTLGWAAAQDYLFVSSILPVRAPWLAGAGALLGGALWVAAVTPVVDVGRGGEGSG